MEQDSLWQTRRANWRRILIIAALLAAAVFCVAFFAHLQAVNPAPTSPTPVITPPPAPLDPMFPGLIACFLDVGQGDCLFFRAPDGKTLLIDAGPPGSFRAIQTHLDAWEVERIDVAVATHLHADHIGGMSEILDHYEVGAFYMPPYDYESSEYANLLAALERSGLTPVTLYADARVFIPWSEECEIRVFSPFRAPYSDYNDTSFVLRVAYQDTAVLCMGDAGEVSERFMIKAFKNRLLRADILKVGHHGSATGTSLKLLRAVRPDIAVISVGASNDYGLPNERVLERLRAEDITIVRTDTDGTLVFALDGTTVRMLK